MHVLIFTVFYIVAAPVPLQALPTNLTLLVPPSTAMGEFSSLTTCQAAGAAHLAAMQEKIKPFTVMATYTCNKKA